MGYDYEHFIVGIDDVGVATVTINRPDKMNAFTYGMERDIAELMWALDRDEDVRVIVLTGAGRAFSSGIDLSQGPQVFSEEGKDDHASTTGGSSESLPERFGWWRMATPIIAAVNGAAIGAGLTMTLLADIRVVAQDAKLQFVFTRRAMLPEANSTWLLTRLIGASRAIELMLTGRRFDGDEAVTYGIAAKALPADEVLAHAQELARDMAVQCSPATVGLAKRVIYHFLGETDRAKAMVQETDLVWWTGTQPDIVAGVMAWMAGKDPQWKMPKHPDVPEELRFYE